MAVVEKLAKLMPVAALLCLLCTLPLKEIPYVPHIIFTGCFDYNQTGACTPETLVGSVGYPNKCYTSGDTVYMYFYTSDYSSPSPCKGKMMWFHIYRTDSTYITTRDAVFHMSDCTTGTSNLTYAVVLSDTLYPDYFLRMKLDNFSQTLGETVLLTDITISPRTLGGNMPLAITKGRISGSMGTKTP
jgi:hypothetical protein